MLPSFPAALPTESQFESNATGLLVNSSKVRPTGLSVVLPPSTISIRILSPPHSAGIPHIPHMCSYILDILCNFQYLRLWIFNDDKNHRATG